MTWEKLREIIRGIGARKLPDTAARNSPQIITDIRAGESAKGIMARVTLLRHEKTEVGGHSPALRTAQTAEATGAGMRGVGANTQVRWLKIPELYGHNAEREPTIFRALTRFVSRIEKKQPGNNIPHYVFIANQPFLEYLLSSAGIGSCPTRAPYGAEVITVNS